jgi:hypothetical protein
MGQTNQQDEKLRHSTRALEIEVVKYFKEHIPRNGKDLIDEGLSLLDDMELWWEKQNLQWVCHNSRKKYRTNIDDTFLPHQKGAISTPLQAAGIQGRNPR